MLARFLPFSSEKLHEYLGYTNPLFGRQKTETITDDLGEHSILRYIPGDASGRWEPCQLEPGVQLKDPLPLYKKLDEAIIEAERNNLG